jgi:NAD(P)-dependent dehydrogenase (short-subunit alcohol dehydrogenase family)
MGLASTVCVADQKSEINRNLKGAPLRIGERKMAELLLVRWNEIRANSVHPGVMPMRTSGRTSDPAVRAERMRFIPMRRPGEVDEVAYAILFLASDEASYITGSEIHVDGGASAFADQALARG